MTAMNPGFLTLVFAALSIAPACSKKDGKSGEGGDIIRIDGSSTVFPITQAVAEDYRGKHGGDVAIGVSGTGGGFKKFCRGDTAMTGASRPIKETELAMCKKTGVEFIELPVAYDGLAVVVHPKNDWAKEMTVAELKTMWAPEAQGEVRKWSQVRDGWPDRDLHLFGPGVDSGTYDYFTKAIVGKEHSSRGDFTANEDDNALVQGVAGDELALGFFGFAYYIENKDRLDLVAIDDGDPKNGEGAIQPSPETVSNGTYQPLSRPIFIYVSVPALERPEVKKFIDFYLDEGMKLAAEVGYVQLPPKAIELAQKRFADRKTGTVFSGGSRVGVTVEELLGGG
jgi:phosphate transport system substrate-binding protein